MIEVCFSIHDKTGTYSKYGGTAVESLLSNTKSNIHVHIVHDRTLTDANRANFLSVVAQHNQKISFHAVDEVIFSLRSENIEKFSIGILFRLILPDILPLEIHHVIYLDADMLVNLDINELWEVSLGGNCIAACHDAGLELIDPWPCKRGMVRRNEYFNSGVLVMNLDSIRRECHLFSEGMEFLKKHPECTFPDQDALNVIFKDKVKYLPDFYNLHTARLRGKNKTIGHGIYHFAGDFINMEEPESMDELFFSHLAKTPWGTQETVMSYFFPYMRRKAELLAASQGIVRRFSDRLVKKKIVFGASSVLCTQILNFFPLNKNGDYYVDNSLSLQGRIVNGVRVFPVEHILKEPWGSFVVLVVSQNHYEEMKEQLLEYGLTENEDFFDGRLFLMQNQGGYAGYY